MILTSETLIRKITAPGYADRVFPGFQSTHKTDIATAWDWLTGGNVALLMRLALVMLGSKRTHEHMVRACSGLALLWHAAGYRAALSYAAAARRGRCDIDGPLVVIRQRRLP